MYKHPLLLIVFLFSIQSLKAQSLERKVIASAGFYYDSPTLSVSSTLGETFVTTLTASGSMLTQGFQQSYVPDFTMKMYIQGYYVGAGRMEPVLFNEGVTGADTGVVDTVTVSLIHPTSLNAVASSKGILACNGLLKATFPEKVLGKSYYIRVTHRNLLETWSASPIDFSLSTTYDFSLANAKAYQDPFNTNPQMIQVEPGIWAMYNGDVNQDGTIDALDFNDMEADANAFNFGYYSTDITNAGPVDALDFNQLEANSGLFLFVARP